MLADSFRLSSRGGHSRLLALGSGVRRIETSDSQKDAKRALLERNGCRRSPPGFDLGYDDAEKNWQNAGCLSYCCGFSSAAMKSCRLSEMQQRGVAHGWIIRHVQQTMVR